jgi:hypothetical protein
VRLSPLGTSATDWLIVRAPDDRWWRWMWNSRWNENWQGKPSATSSSTNPTWPDMCSNWDGCRGKPATNRRSYGTAYMKCFGDCFCLHRHGFVSCSHSLVCTERMGHTSHESVVMEAMIVSETLRTNPISTQLVIEDFVVNRSLSILWILTGVVGRLVDCSVIGLAFGMKLEELIMDTGRTTSIPVGHFRKEQAGGGHAAADPRWWCMRYANGCV